MSSFNIAVTELLKAEGGYTNDPADRGKETKFGISKRSYPQLDIANLTRDQAIAIYKRDFWDLDYDGILSQAIANKVLSFAVLMWKKPAHVCIQRAVRAASGKVLILDGDFGSVTLKAVNECNPDALLAALKSEGAAYFRSINNPKFQAGWANRAYA